MVFPARYYLSLVKVIFLKGTGLGPLLPQLLALAIFVAILATLALRSFKKSL